MPPKNPEEFHQKLSLVFHATLALPIAAFIYLFLELRNNSLQPALEGESMVSLTVFLLPLPALLLAIIGYRQFRKSLLGIDTQNELPVKLEQYHQSMSVFYYYMAGSAVLWVLGLYLTTSPVFIIGYVFLLFFMSFQRPGPDKYVKDLALKGDQRDIILKKREF